MLVNVINEKLKIQDKVKIIQAMGYKNVKKGLITLEKFLTCKDLASWLREGHYDLVFTGEDFFIKLCDLLEIEQNLYLGEIEIAKDYNNALHQLKPTYIFVYTDFKRKNEPIFALACLESTRRLNIDKKQILYKSSEEIFALVTSMIREHYVNNEGELKVWGKIQNYVLHLQGEKYVFNTQGAFVDGERKNICQK